ncbi:hypothetical protein [Polycyclovorans algicola]|uniref:hypothetical protein n=1 Tax=Polycyclovorans algicola TaxID=616992 RepID=UPI001267EF5F|nr:hypothetical protein [Polycyclovorans algicola]
MSQLLTSSRRPGRRLSSARRQRGGLLFWALVVLVGAAVGAALVFHFVIRHLQAQLLVTNETLMAYVDQPLEIEASVLNQLDIRLDETVSTRVPVDTLLSVPVEQALELDAVFDAVVPIRVDVPVEDTIYLEQDVDIDTIVQADLLGETFDLPLRGSFPVRAEVPVTILVPIDQNVRLRFTAPIKARMRQNLEVPLKTEIVADVPLSTQMSVPVLNDLLVTAEVDKSPLLEVKLNYADLLIPVGKVGFGWADDDAPDATPTPEPNP